MSSLTGDFPAIFQVSGGTINRLLASMHQNDRSDDWTPSLPHSVELRIGEEGTYDVPVGVIAAQIGVPQIRLRHGSTDRFGLEVGIRASYEPDPWAGPLADFIHGTVTAEYELTRPDPAWPGWSGVDVSQYLAVRVVEGSVAFSGELGAGWGWSGGTPDAEAITPLIAAEITKLLQTSFQATPIPAPRFGPGRLRSLEGPGGSAVAGPIDPGAGRIESIGEEWLGGRDVGLALSSDFLLSRLQASLHGLYFPPLVRIDYGIGSADYNIGITVDPPEWRDSGDQASISVKITGSATSDDFGFPNVHIDVVQTVDLKFDAANRLFTLTPAPPQVYPDAGDGPLSGAIESAVKKVVAAQLRDSVGPALQPATSALNGFLAGGDALGAELRRLDRWLTLSLDEAVFRADGVAVRGKIRVAPRSKPVVTFAPTADRTAFTALKSWIPGGLVTRVYWTWYWPSGEKGHTKPKYTDRFLLRGPPGGSPGIPDVKHGPLPGLDGNGGVVLSVDAKVVDEQSGELRDLPDVPARAIGFHYRFPWELPPGVGDLYWREDLGFGGGEGPHPDELDLGAITRPRRRPRLSSTNTLIVTQGHALTLETIETVERSVAEHERPDAGLLTVTVFGDGDAARVEPGVVERLNRLRGELGTPLLVAETVDSVLWDGLALPRGTDEPSFRLISPGGGVTWSHDGSLSSDDLVTALNTTLMPSLPPAPEMVAFGPAPGTHLWEAVSDGPGRDGLGAPSPPMGRHDDGPRLALFVDSRSAASVEQVRNRERDGTAVFVNGDLEHVQMLNSQLDDGVDAIPDPGGAIAARLGISCWPTTVRLDERGVVIESWVGTPP
jgi:hypothetical protein